MLSGCVGDCRRGYPQSTCQLIEYRLQKPFPLATKGDFIHGSSRRKRPATPRAELSTQAFDRRVIERWCETAIPSHAYMRCLSRSKLRVVLDYGRSPEESPARGTVSNPPSSS